MIYTKQDPNKKHLIRCNKTSPNDMRGNNLLKKIIRGNKNNKSYFLFLIGVITLLSLLSPVLAHSGEDDFGHHGMMGNFGMNWMGGFGMGIFMWIFMILIVIVLILFIAWLIKQIQK